MNGPDQATPGAGPPPEPPAEEPEPLLWRVLRSTIAPPVLGDGGHDAPLSPRGRVVFYGVVGLLVVAIGLLFVLTLAK